jgi:uncharacterized phage-associated protein
VPGFSQIKEHKLLYYCQAFHVAAFGEPLFRETISAWDMGPVVGEFWHEEQEHRTPGSSDALSEAELNTVGYVVSRYGRLSARDLINLSHSEEPWQRANKKRGLRKKRSVRIELKWMRDYFSQDRGEADDAWPDTATIRQWLDAAASERGSGPLPRQNTREEILARLGRG